MWLTASTAVPQMLGEAELAEVFSGHEIAGTYGDGSTFRERYDVDGSLSYSDAKGEAGGQWFVRDGTFCTFYEDLQGGCFTVERMGRNCFDFYFVTSLPGSIPGGEKPKYTARAALTDAPSTCPALLQS